MTNPASSRETIGDLTRSELEHLIEIIAKKNYPEGNDSSETK